MKKLRQLSTIGLALLIAVFSTQILPVASAYAASNNGTLKVHEKGTPSGTESNDPKVCVFNFEASGLDAGQTGDITIETQSGTPITPVTVSLTTDANGNGATEYINDTTSTVTLPNGHYKATLDTKFGTDDGDKAKSKVFKVTCAEQSTSVTPNVTIVDQCGTGNDNVTGTAVAGIAYTITKNGLVYTVVASPQNESYTLVEGNGFSLNRDGTATREVALTNENCMQTIIPCERISGPTVITAKNQFADWNDDRSAGHAAFTQSGLHIWTDDDSSNAKVAWYHNVDFALSQVGAPAIDYTATSGIQPGLQMTVDFDGNGTADGILVGESTSYGDNWWLSNGSAQFVKDSAPNNDGGNGSQWFGTLDEWLTSFPNAQVMSVGFSLGSGVYADGVLHSLTFGCHKYEFTVPPTPVAVVKPDMYDYCYDDQDGIYVYSGEARGVIYYVNGEVVSGFYHYDGTPIVVTAEAQSGYTLTGYDGPWTFGSADFTNENCLTISKKVISVADTNQNGVIGLNDTITWEITITNNSKNDYEPFYVEIDDQVATIQGDSAGYLAAGESATVTATTTISANDVQTCKTVNTASFAAWRIFGEKVSERLLFDEESDVPVPLTTGSTVATYSFTCPPIGMGSAGQPSQPTSPASPVVQELPHTGPAENNMLAIGAAIAVLVYGAVYFAQPKRRFDRTL